MSSVQTRVVTNTAEFRKAIDDGLTAEQIEVGLPAEDQKRIDDARADGFRDGRERASREAANAAAITERDRIMELRNITPDGFQTELQTAIDEGTEPGAFAMKILQLQQDLRTAHESSKH